MKVKVIKQYFDRVSQKYVQVGAQFDVDDKRSKQLIDAGVVEEVKEVKEVKQTKDVTDKK